MDSKHHRAVAEHLAALYDARGFPGVDAGRVDAAIAQQEEWGRCLVWGGPSPAGPSVPVPLITYRCDRCDAKHEGPPAPSYSHQGDCPAASHHTWAIRSVAWPSIGGEMGEGGE